MTTLTDKTAVTPRVEKQTDRAWLNFLLVVLLAATILPLPGGADGIHCAAGMLLLGVCAIHLVRHRRWIKAVILDKPITVSPMLHRQRRLFCAMLLSGSICGSSGLINLLSFHIFLPLLCLIAPLHVSSGLTFSGLIVYHLFLHRNWFATKIGRLFYVGRR
jgi:hypothetical protein